MKTIAKAIMCIALTSVSSAHEGSHAEKSLRGVTLGQLGPLDISCVTASAGTGAKVFAVNIENDVKEISKLIAVHKDGNTKTTCSSPHTGVTTIAPKNDFRLMVDEMVEYVVVMGKKETGWKDVHEIWRTINGTKPVWPQNEQIWDSTSADNRDSHIGKTKNFEENIMMDDKELESILDSVGF
jgi:hypothetical protein